MNRFSFILITWLVFKCGILRGQELPAHAQHQLENDAVVTGMQLHPDEGFLNDLLYYRKHPLSLNTVGAESLESLHFLSRQQIIDFILYRKLNGKMIDIYELQSIPGWDLKAIEEILPYVTLKDEFSIRETLLKRFQHGDRSVNIELSQVIEKAKGYDTSIANHYLGSPQHLLLKYTFKNKDLLQYGFLGEKDPGEQFFKGAQSKGFDFYTFHLFFRKIGSIKALAIGDFNVDMGQGLIQWQSLLFYNSSGVSSIEKQSQILSPYRAAGEFNLYRGIGITLKNKSLETTTFSSYKKFSGRLNDTTDMFSSFLNSGLNRTPSEISNKNAISLLSIGGNLTYKNDFLKIGINGIHHTFSIPLGKPNKPYNYYFFSGTRLTNFSADYSYAFKNIRLFGELALDGNFNKALIQGILLSLNRKTDFSIFYKNIGENYQSLFGRAFTSTTYPVNEKGVYIGMDIKPDPTFIINTSVDIFRYPWLKYRIDAPSRGSTFNLMLHYQPDKIFTFYLNYRNKNRPLNIKYPDSALYVVGNEINKSVLFQFSARLNPSFTVNSQFQTIWIFNKEKAFSAYLDFKNHHSKKLENSIRLQYFETALDNVLYTFETSAINYYSTPSSTGNGIRYYITISYAISDRISLYVNWSQTIYKDKREVGYGSEIINGNKRSQLSFQLKYEW